MRLVYSVRTPDELIYADELDPDTELTFTREAPEGWTGHTGHIDAELIARAAHGMDAAAGTVFICGSNGFVETAATLALGAGFEAGRIRTERFGPSG
jgi:ferredoxin-NADP reductase